MLDFGPRTKFPVSSSFSMTESNDGLTTLSCCHPSGYCQIGLTHQLHDVLNRQTGDSGEAGVLLGWVSDALRPGVVRKSSERQGTAHGPGSVQSCRLERGRPVRIWPPTKAVVWARRHPDTEPARWSSECIDALHCCRGRQALSYQEATRRRPGRD